MVGSRSVSEPEKEFHESREPWWLLTGGIGLGLDVLVDAEGPVGDGVSRRERLLNLLVS